MNGEKLGDNVTLYLGDCLDILPTISSVDSVITDPVWPNCPPGLLQGCDNPSDLLNNSLLKIEAKRVVVVVRYDSDPRFLNSVPSKWKFFRVQSMSYSVPGYNGRKLGGEEIVYSFGEPVKSNIGRRVIPGRGPSAKKTKDNGHPCPRSEEHFRWLVNWWSDSEEIVLDPFMGSGTTGVACVQMGRKFIGIEIDPGYYEIAKKRIQQAQLQVRMPI